MATSARTSAPWLGGPSQKWVEYPFLTMIAVARSLVWTIFFSISWEFAHILGIANKFPEIPNYSFDSDISL